MGVIVYELFTGRTPYHDLAEGDIPAVLRQARPFDLSAIADPRWRMLVQGLLTVDRDSRWQHTNARTGGCARTAAGCSGGWPTRCPGPSPKWSAG
ncbi:hypothetical protein [Streptosporangium roseum]|uniref:hypothetical protein n=1 Tax=Streptosporangium roseum TaxID=2001 RepID=UPI000305A01D|nr:hypothetical protein [Streptosporangium roseum]